MKFLVVVRQKKNVDTFAQVFVHLLAAGHAVTLAIQERLDDAARRALAARFPRAGFELVAPPDGRGDQWRASAPLLRAARDWAQYLRPPYRHAVKLRHRAVHRLVKEAGIVHPFAADLLIDDMHAERIRAALAQIERGIPSDALHEEFIRRHGPDVVLVTPGVHFGSVQTDIIKSARACGVPVWMLLFSWDNLSSKGALHARPDRMFVWNEWQRREAAELHDYPSERVIVAGAPRFDEFFTLRSVMDYDDFLRPLELPTDAPTLLYVCSSRFIAADELSFVRRWLAAVRGADHALLRRCNVIVRPHPDQVLVDTEEPVACTWPAVRQATGWIQRPFGDPQALVLRTTYGTPQAFYECLHHASAIVGLNTSAELEAGIAGRPVFTVLADGPGADGQSHTLHFNYLLREHGGFVTFAPDMRTHLAQLADAFDRPADLAAHQQFVRAFLRPHGDEPVAPLLARLLETTPRETAAQTLVREASNADVGPMAPDARRDVAAKTLVLGYAGSTARVSATGETRGRRRHGVLILDETTTSWIDAHVHPGDVFYDVGADIGAYALVAALHRGAHVVAFEPGFASFKHLCDNLLMNGCYRSIVPLPLALGERTGLVDLEYAGDAGGHKHGLTGRRWRARSDAVEARYTQPVCAEPLDDVLRRHALPHPHVMRVALRGCAGAMLRGASDLLRSTQLRAILISVSSERDAEQVAAAAGRAFSAAYVAGAGADRHILLQRTATTGRMFAGPRFWDRLTGAFAR